MRTAQDHSFGGPWYGTTKTTGFNALKLPVATWRKIFETSHDSIASRLARGIPTLLGEFHFKHFISEEDCLLRPHWVDATMLGKKEIMTRKWMEGYFPIPLTVEENQRRYPWPQALAWYQKVRILSIELMFTTTPDAPLRITKSFNVPICSSCRGPPTVYKFHFIVKSCEMRLNDLFQSTNVTVHATSNEAPATDRNAEELTKKMNKLEEELRDNHAALPALVEKAVTEAVREMKQRADAAERQASKAQQAYADVQTEVDGLHQRLEYYQRAEASSRKEIESIQAMLATTTDVLICDFFLIRNGKADNNLSGGKRKSGKRHGRRQDRPR